MEKEAFCLHERIKTIKLDLASAESELKRLQSTCRHKWQVDFTPIVTPGYEYGDPPGVGGSDHIPRSWVPEQRKPCWTRQCNLCGLTEKTDRTVTKTVSGRIPGTSGTEEVPVFDGDRR